MKNNYLKQLLQLPASILACAVICIGNPASTTPTPGNIGNEQNVENSDTENGKSEESGISTQNDKGDNVPKAQNG